MSKAKQHNQSSNAPSMNGFIAPLLDDGKLVFRVRAADGSETLCAVDLLNTKLACERLQDKHKLQERDGILSPTPEFLQELIVTLKPLGVTGATPSTAYQIWVMVGIRMAELQKKMFAMPN